MREQTGNAVKVGRYAGTLRRLTNFRSRVRSTQPRFPCGAFFFGARQMRRDTLKFELTGCGLMLLAFVIALGLGLVAILAEAPVSLATALMVVSFVAFCWVGDRLGD
jgi:hypothetical protein